MPQKPFEYMIVRLNKDVGALNFKEGDVVIVTPHNWYGNTNGWSKEDPMAHIFKQQEIEKYTNNPYLANDERVYWNQERGYNLHYYDGENMVSITVDYNMNHWEILNIDGVHQNDLDLPNGAIETLQSYVK